MGSVRKGGPAAGAGIEPGDVIVGFNGRAIERSTELPPLVAATKPGSTAKVEIWRNGATKTLDVAVGARDEPKRLASAGEDAAPGGRLGVSVRPLTAQEKASGQVAGGVVVEQVGGAAGKAGIRTGDVILSVNRVPVATPDDLKNALGKSGSTVALLVQRGDARIFVPVTIG